MEYGKGRDEDGTETYWFRWGGERFNPEPPRGPAREAIKELRARVRRGAGETQGGAAGDTEAAAPKKKKRERSGPEAGEMRVTRARVRAQGTSDRGPEPAAERAPKRGRADSEVESERARKAPRILRGAAGP